MTMRSRPCSAFKRRALERSSMTVMPGVSSIHRGALVRRSAALMTFCHSSSLRSPTRSLWESTCPSELNMRRASCSLDISREKKATVFLLRMAALVAILRVKAVFPMEGRAATKMRSEG